MPKGKKEILAEKCVLNEKSSKNLKSQLKRINQINSQQRVVLPQIKVCSSEKLQAKINMFKTEQLSLKKSLEQEIQGNLKYRSNSASSLQKQRRMKLLDKKHRQKHQSLVNLKKNFSKRVQFNHQANLRLLKMQEEINLKKNAVAKRLSLIQAQNLQKIKEIEEFEKNFMAQVKAEMSKNLEKQKRLKMQYERISQQGTKIEKTKQHQNKLDEETWKQIMNLKLNLQGMMSKQKGRQNKLIEEKDVDLLKKQEKSQQQNQKQEPKNKKTQRKRVKLDPKEAGKQYLDFAKKRGSVGQKVSNKLKQNYLDINLKIINYDNPILQAISNNDGYLSKNIHIQQQYTGLHHPNFDKKVNPTLKQQLWNESQQKNLSQNQFLSDVIPILQQNKQQDEDSSFSEVQRFD